jgi:hypothetical protein
LLALALLGVCLGATPVPAQEPETALAPTIGVDEIQRGQRGYGLSVFAGSEVERFEVEVLGVLRGSSPGSSAILARLSGQGLEHSGVIAGMSGSPVYIDDRLAGAIAFGWNFSKDPIAGITPIAEMRELGTAMPGSETQKTGASPGLLPTGDQRAVILSDLLPDIDQKAGSSSGSQGFRGPAAPAVTLKQWLDGELGEEILAAELRKLVPKVADEASSGLLWTAAGFGETSRGLLQSGLGRVSSAGVMGGGEAESAGRELVPGSPVAAVLIRGDLSLAATGTVTDRHGEQILAFGHPFLGFGPVDMPMATAEVITVIPSLSNSFKLTNLGPVVGAFRQDRSVGMLGRTGDRARLIPTTLRIAGDGVIGPREFQLEVARLPQITPTLLAVATLGGLESAGHREGDQGLDLRATLHLKDHGEVVVEQSFDGSGVSVQAALHLLAFSSLALNSSLAEVELESVEVELTRSPQVRLAQIVGAYAERTSARPGETVPVQVELVAHGGERSRQRVLVEVPEDLDEGPYFLLLGDGLSADAARMLVEPAAPVNFRQLLRMLRSLHSRRELVVLGLVRDSGLVLDGEVLPRLPGSVRSLWGSAAAGGAQPLQLAIARQQVEPMTLPMTGMARVDLEIRRPDGHP